jgi:phosphatidylserine/phosphatidylglycerophosphate/cardiolipin synthase-like enzyme
MTIHAIPINDAKVTLLTGDDWSVFLERSLNNATTSVYVSVYLFSHHWGKVVVGRTDLYGALQNVAKRGLDCRAVLNTPVKVPGLGRMNKPAGDALESAGWKVRYMPKGRVLHEKIIIVDMKSVIIGSHNISKSSAARNYDTSICIENVHIAKLMLLQFSSRWRVGGCSNRS